MLKFQKAAKNRDVSIYFRSKEPFLNKTFLICLACALIFHLGGLLLFRIGPLRFHPSQYVLPYTSVNTDLTLSTDDAFVIAKLDEEPLNIKYPFEPKRTLPTLPDLPQPVLIHQMEYVKENATHADPFIELERHPLSISKKVNDSIKKALRCHLLGSLRKAKIRFFPSIAFEKPFYALFEIKIDNMTGMICWYELKSFEGDQKDESEITQLLKSMRFEHDQTSVMSSGEFEMMNL